MDESVYEVRVRATETVVGKVGEAASRLGVSRAVIARVLGVSVGAVTGAGAARAGSLSMGTVATIAAATGTSIHDVLSPDTPLIVDDDAVAAEVSRMRVEVLRRRRDALDAQLSEILASAGAESGDENEDEDGGESDDGQ